MSEEKDLNKLKRFFSFLICVLKYAIMILLISASIDSRKDIMSKKPFQINFEYRVY